MSSEFARAEKTAASLAPLRQLRQRRLERINAADLPADEQRFDDELVEGFIGKAVLAVLYGDSNSGKTFLAVDLAGCVADGVGWHGRNVVPGAVVYLATEAAASVLLRVAAFRKAHRTECRLLEIVVSPVSLFDAEADIEAVLALVREVEALHGDKVVLIIGDTLARLSAGANENSGEDMGIVVRNADRIRAETGATFLLIHHCGKDAAKGMRGWSGMRAAIDTEIEVSSDEATGLRCAEVTKQRDLPGKGERIGFRLETIEMGVNRWGNRRTTCVVSSADAPAKVAKCKRPSEISGAITEFLIARGTGCLRGALAKHFEGRYHRASIYKEVNKMLVSGLLIEATGIVTLPGRHGVKP